MEEGNLRDQIGATVIHSLVVEMNCTLQKVRKIKEYLLKVLEPIL